MSSRLLYFVLFIAAAGCQPSNGGGMDAAPKIDPIFPADYKATYVQVRDCRASADHDLDHIKVLVDPGSTRAYMRRDVPFPTGAVVLKEQYDPSDNTCTGAITQWTVMVKQAVGSSASTLDWHWQRVDVDRNVTSDNEARCIGCHTSCGKPPDGYDGTCAAPP